MNRKIWLVVATAAAIAGLALVGSEELVDRIVGASLVGLTVVSAAAWTKSAQAKRKLEYKESFLMLGERLDDVERLLEASRAFDQRIESSTTKLVEQLNGRSPDTRPKNTDIETKFEETSHEIRYVHDQLTERLNAFAEGILEEVADAQIQLDRQARSTERESRQATGQMEALMGIYATLRPDRPYPEFGGWALSADAARRLVSVILSTEPRLIVDVGSGVSTLLEAQALERLGSEGVVIALEHEEHWCESTRRLLAEHGMSHRATVIHSPLVKHQLHLESFSWYDLKKVDFPRPIDLVFVDGPPKSTGDLARYPALPLLLSALAPDAVILMDDAGRPEERAAVERWLEEYPDLTATFHKDEKGTAELIRRSI